jgi:Bacterial self-protective colicin-like immunity
MESYGEVGVPEFLQLMKDYLDGRTDVRSYRQGYFALMKKRMVLNEEESRILQTAYGDADDYDPLIRLAHTIEEPELRKRVAKSLEELVTVRNAAQPEP